MQLALTTQIWCDFVLYTNKGTVDSSASWVNVSRCEFKSSYKGIVIDRVRYNEQYSFKLRDKLLNFYFYFLLDELYEKKKPTLNV